MSSSIGVGPNGLRLLPGAAVAAASALGAIDAPLHSVVVVATWPTMRAGLRALVEATPGFSVVAEASGDADVDHQDAGASDGVSEAPEALVIDVDPDHTADVRRLLARWPDAAALLLIDHAERLPQVITGGLPQRATAVLLRDSSAHEIGVALQAAIAGMVVLDPAIVAGLGSARPGSTSTARSYDLDLGLDLDLPGGLDGERSPASADLSGAEGDDPRDVLTERERQVLHLVALGMPNKAIAAELGISEHTAKFHVGAILAKLSAASRAEAVAIAARRGMLSL